MKKIIFTILVLPFVSISFANAQGSILNLSINSNNLFTLQLDNNYPSAPSRSFSLQNINSGSHFLRIYKMKNFYSSREVFSGYIEIPFNTIVTATLERNGFIRILNTEPLNIPSACINNNGNYNNNCQSIPLYNCESHYSPFDNYSSVVRPISTNEFENIMNTLNNISFDSSLLNVAKQILSSKYVTTDQVIRILQLFTFDSSRLDIAKFAYNRTVDKSHYFQTYNSFTFDSSVNELSNYIGQMG